MVAIIFFEITEGNTRVCDYIINHFRLYLDYNKILCHRVIQ